jgi:hypothetical protein
MNLPLPPHFPSLSHSHLLALHFEARAYGAQLACTSLFFSFSLTYAPTVFKKRAPTARNIHICTFHLSPPSSFFSPLRCPSCVFKRAPTARNMHAPLPSPRVLALHFPAKISCVQALHLPE